MDLSTCLLFIRNKSLDVFLIVVLLFCFASETYCYDSLDPNGNITIRWDLITDNPGGTQDILVSIVNNQLFRHIDYPGWKLSWVWPEKQVIWNIFGAEATEQGNCSAFKGQALPHCCLKKPVVIDLLPGAPYNKQFANCCKGGVLSSISQDPEKSLAAFQMNIGGVAPKQGVPENISFTLGIPGYTCGPLQQVPPTKFYEDHGRRKRQALETWNATCTYSQFRASPAPTCCVSLSAFYDSTIVQCPKCSCACRQLSESKCVDKRADLPTLLPLDHSGQPKPVLHCSDNMCPIQVHWHIKQSYTEYWRIKITITNRNYVKNYSDWTLVAQHPNFSNVTQVFSFNYKPLVVYGNINDTGMFYGIQHYNDMLLQAGESGNVQTEMLMDKVKGLFTFGEGWGFPRKINFNGDECVMPRPDDYPRLPNSTPRLHFHAAPLVASVIHSLFVLVIVCS